MKDRQADGETGAGGKLTVLERLWLKAATIGVSLLLSAFISAVLLLVLSRSPPETFIASIFSEEIRFAIVLSIKTSIASTALCILVAVPAAYALARYDFFGKRAASTLLDMPLALPPLVAGVGLLLFFGTSPLGRGLSEAGLVFVFTPLGIVIAQFFVNVPFMLRVMRSTFEGISPRYEHVARTLGCTDFQAIMRVTLPMASNGLLAGSVITWSKAVGEFGAVLMLAGATRMRTETLPTSLFLNMSCGKLDEAISAASILILISVVSLYVFERRVGGFRL
ncbi:MAG: ABC transporter permease [Methanothrix sp.]|jgi:molybdate transport system permease protein|uniref:NifC-like ABC-type porter n=1 Tax=Methanothrix harundinacea TaxID=301375 RepID=A0A124G322_9EURY|nr:MAG: NifC-like ABC-type porter [Methanothrix harundinacea]KUK95557.1 MAG: NifC-like ABC-type porter [Methanothrix harundinacea]MDD3710462.1 ABC transporter permease [Methanothrix sp.]MDD5768731.1 ABC transporter permease [Methanothrix sp.]